ncbi:MAG: hypothetical protein M3P48_04390, partial [Actinomycetota bacterium]|nr:hypothetical protein [Actinomycetota bacterium]
PAPSTVTIAVNGHHVSMPDSLRSSRYRFVVKGTGGVQLVKPDRGYTPGEFVRDLKRAERGSERAMQRVADNVRFFGGVVNGPKQRGEFWETVYTGTYWALSLDALDRLPRVSEIEVVKVHGNVRATAWPGSTGVVTLRDKGIRVASTLPRSGRLLVRNRGSEVDLVVVLQLAPGKTVKDLREAVKGDPTAVISDIAVPVALLSADTQALWGYSLPKGNYVFAGVRSVLHTRSFETLRSVRIA